MSIEAMKQALEFIKATNKSSSFLLVPASQLNQTVTALSTAIAEAEKQEPAYRCRPYSSVPGEAVSPAVDYYTAPPAAQRQPLIPTSLAEQQFERYYRQGYDAGFAAQRQPLTDKQIGKILDDPNIAEAHQGNWRVLPYAYARAIEAAHGIGVSQ